jgi:hypothetical protein
VRTWFQEEYSIGEDAVENCIICCFILTFKYYYDEGSEDNKKAGICSTNVGKAELK